MALRLISVACALCAACLLATVQASPSTSVGHEIVCSLTVFVAAGAMDHPLQAELMAKSGAVLHCGALGEKTDEELTRSGFDFASATEMQSTLDGQPRTRRVY